MITKNSSRGLLKILLSVALFSACTPSSPDYIADYDLVYTKERSGYDFSAVHTYFLPDSVAHVGGDSKHIYDSTILKSLKTNLDALGWTRLTETGTEKADVMVFPAANEVTYASCTAYCWYCYWGWYPGWGYYPPYPGYGWGYPSDIVCASYNTGTVVVTMTDPNKAANDTIPVAWVGILNGLLEGSQAEITSRINTNIDQMFIQSPYLKQ
ncbi:DUF4136 domain-containing protein [Flavihumibacter profundi]|jgi:hypothetical protein|uniref:DUF4136 domain-containing protein n=1 Tax=Flavihumibacter profundi TaxID=2716883 RepID=UPI001CC3960B|nr:DUF4136 domain-containing protein [Flavihumibacter profundi]MBZ5859020.1 DUF4136 domain-containing protein [Flavihumibacter profundi]